MYSGMGQKVGFLVHNLSTLVAGLAVGFLRSWKLTLVVMSFLPLLGVAATVIKVTVRAAQAGQRRGV
jgi:ATP-binding cassette subfamily B (MDR/TAP) protein 1